MKALIMVLSLMGFGFSAQAGVSIVKAFDGNVAYCNQETRLKGKVIQVEMTNVVSSDSQDDATMTVSLVKCENGSWVKDTQPSVENYTAPNGEDVKVTYSNYELLIVNKNYDIVLQTELSHLNTVNNTQSAQFSLVRTRDAGQIFEASIRAIKHVEASGGQKFSEVINFGVFNVRLTDAN